MARNQKESEMGKENSKEVARIDTKSIQSHCDTIAPLFFTTIKASEVLRFRSLCEISRTK